MDVKEITKNLQDGAVDLALGTGVAVVSLHVARKMPKYSGWVLLGAGLIGIMVGGKVFKSASIVSASLGTIAVMNSIAADNGVPAITGFKGTINKFIPQLATGAAPAMGWLGDVENLNEKLLGEGNEDGMETNDALDELTGLGENLENKLLGLESVM
ncbi:MAG: hypothetical protein AAB638_00760 [Patescibacteria group bacterium]|mgnify:CR=1 FL=1